MLFSTRPSKELLALIDEEKSKLNRPSKKELSKYLLQNLQGKFQSQRNYVLGSNSLNYQLQNFRVSSPSQSYKYEVFTVCVMVKIISAMVSGKESENSPNN